MDTSRLKRFAQFARRSLIEQVTSRLNLVLQPESMARREYGEAIADLEKEIKASSKEQVIDRVAYVWFNRFCALRFMDVNRYTKIGVLSPAEGQFQPEILAEAKMGHIDEDLVADAVVRNRIFALLNGSSPSPDPQTEAYRSLIVSVCNHFYKAMPYLFDRIANYTELLMPDDLLSGNSILAYTREAMTPDVCKDVEAIGWLYQFYISEKKDEVFDGLKKNRKITPENIPAATQLFTPNWIVRYLVENSLGRLWMLNRPNSRLIEQMEYYIAPEQGLVGVRDQGLGVSNNINLGGFGDGGEELSGFNRLAKGDECGDVGLSGDETVSEGGDLWSDESGETGGGVDSVKYRGRSREKLNGAIQELSVNSAGFQGGGGDSDHDRSTSKLSETARGSGNSIFAAGGVEDVGGFAGEVERLGVRDQGLGVSRVSSAGELIPNPYPLNPSNPLIPNPYLLITSPEDIKICDPACGSGHMLVYAFDLLYAIYEEEGYEPAEIPEKILTLNLFGIEIDERAGELAAFALTMKARAKHRRFFNKGIKPNICVLGNVEFSGELEVGSGEFLGVRVQDLGVRLEDLLHDLRLFGEANNFGSLLRPRLSSVQVESVRSALTSHWSLIPNPSLFDNQTHEKVLRVLRQADFLSSKYHVVIANPPYMGGKGMNNRLKAFLQDNYSDVKSDVFSAFMVRITEMTLPKGEIGFVTPYVWMFISSYEKLRHFLLEKTTITSLIQLEYNAFAPACIPVATFTLSNQNLPSFKGGYVKLSDFRGEENQAPKALEAIKNPNCGWFYRASADDFKKIPSSAIAYWTSLKVREIFVESYPLSNEADIGKGLDTGDNNRFLRLWFETSWNNKKWIPCQKGGTYRKWYGNNEYLINWGKEGEELKNFSGSNLRNSHNYFKSGLSWTRVSSSSTAFRFFPEGFIFESTGPCLFSYSIKIESLAAFLNSKLTVRFLSIIAPTLDFQSGHISNLPILKFDWYNESIINLAKSCIEFEKYDWDSYETSWDFKTLPLLKVESNQNNKLHTSNSLLSTKYAQLRQHWQQTTLEMQRLEEENNRIFIEAYGLQDELTPEVPLKEITLTCNPHYRYDSNKSEAELETLLLADTMREFISYAVGCMFGRYSLDKEGLILANQGEGIEDYLRKVGEGIGIRDQGIGISSAETTLTPNPYSLTPTTTNVIPIIEGDWFTDDISEQFRKFLRLTFGEENYQANLTFIENALDKPIQKYFLKDFYNDHVKRYKKRPIYWLFSSPKGNFNALIYLHRYRPDTASIVLNDYLREYRAKLTAHKTHLEAVSIAQNTTQSEKTKALKTIENLRKIIDELEKYERDILYPLASQQLAIDLDDGVKVNYGKFGAALKKIAGLDAAED